MSSFPPKITTSTFTTSATKKPYTYISAGPSTGPLIIFLHGWPGIALTWLPQIQTLSSLGFHCVAPDMPGYGGTWTSKDSSAFALEKLVPDFLDLLKHLGKEKAVWVGHDWGCPPVWALASHHPEVCRAVVGISVPYRTIELGLDSLMKTIDRERYPEDKYPYGQWGYQVFYEEHPTAIDEQFEANNFANVEKYFKLLYARGSEAGGKGIARTALVREDKGWFGGPNAQVPDLPLEKTTLSQEILTELVNSAKKNGWHGSTAWYLNHAANRKYTLEKSVHDGVLKMPVLFIHTEYDAVCQTVSNPRAVEEMRASTEQLSEFVIDAGHWGNLERPEKVSLGIVEWIEKNVKDYWPGAELKSRF